MVLDLFAKAIVDTATFGYAADQQNNSDHNQECFEEWQWPTEMEQFRCAKDERYYTKGNRNYVRRNLAEIAHHVQPQKNNCNPQSACTSGFARNGFRPQSYERLGVWEEERPCI